MQTVYFEKLFLFFIILLTTAIAAIFFPLIALMLSSIMTVSISSIIGINIPPSIFAGIIIGLILTGASIYKIRFTEYGPKYGDFSWNKFLLNILALPLLVGLVSDHLHITLSVESFLNHSDMIISFFENSSISINPEVAKYFSIVGGVLGIAFLTLWFAKLALFHLILWFANILYTIFQLAIYSSI